MNGIQSLWDDAVGYLQPYPLLQAVLIVVASLLVAVIVDRLITGVVSRVVSRTQTRLDDRLIKILHRPIFTTVALAGLLLATYRLDFNDVLQLVTVAAIKTLLVLIWLAFASRFVSLVLGAMKRQEDRFQFVQQTTEPLRSNA